MTERSGRLAVKRIKPNPANIRTDLGDLTELAASIAARGVQQPLILRPHPTLSGMFIIIDGERRWTAAGMAGVDEVPVWIRPAQGAEEDTADMLVAAMRSGLNPMDRAAGFGKLRAKGWSLARIAHRTGYSQATVSASLALLGLSPADQAKIRRGELSATTVAKAQRETRSRARGKPHGNTRWDPPHLAAGHPLAAEARKMCEAEGHPAHRKRLNRVACEECWEQAIRADEQATVAIGDALLATPVPERVPA
jgi:ParB family chromosome partitioning protein